MCGRYVLTTPAQVIADHFAVPAVPAFRASWNIAPTALVPVIRAAADGTRECVLLRWGFVPAWARDPAAMTLLNNARAESLAEKPAFRTAWRKRRCVIPANGWYEWDEKVQPRQPHYFDPVDGRLAAMAGLWESWRSADGEVLDTFAIVTRAANADTAAVHDRMPRLLDPDEMARWLDPRAEPLDLLGSPVTVPVRTRPVGLGVNSVRNDSARNVEPVTIVAPAQGSLF